MNIFLDTSVLVASTTASHPHFEQASRAVAQAAAKGNRGFISQHSIAEVYAILTSAPLVPRIQPIEALRILEEDILPTFTAVTLEPDDYREVVRLTAAGGWRSGRVYDALLLRCAEKQRVDRVYTFNMRDFLALAPGRLRSKILVPA